jgi:hypothetical protein
MEGRQGGSTGACHDRHRWDALCLLCNVCRSHCLLPPVPPARVQRQRLPASCTWLPYTMHGSSFGMLHCS